MRIILREFKNRNSRKPLHLGKDGSPSIEGLQLALLDGALSVLRSDRDPVDPNVHAALALESIEIIGARYMGRPQPFTIKLNPWLNTIIGGRGTGKSTLIEFLRLALRRDDELPESLKEEFKKYEQVYQSREEGGLLRSDTALSAIYLRNGARFLVQWNPDGSLEPIQEEKEGSWKRAEVIFGNDFPFECTARNRYFTSRKRRLLC